MVKPRKTKPNLSRERVLDAAIALADAQGIANLSMRKLAQSLRVEAMSLYNHVANKEALLLAMQERVAESYYHPQAGGDWRAEMRQRAIRAHEVLIAHPWASQLMVSKVNTAPAILGYVDATIGCLTAAGFSYPMADAAWNAVDSHIYGHTMQALNFPFEPDEYAQVAADYTPELPPEIYPNLRGMSDAVMSGAHDGLTPFTFGLDILLGGLEEMRAAQVQRPADIAP